MENEPTPVFGFEKDEKSKKLPMKLLKQSVRVEGNLGRSYRTRPVQAWTLLTMIAEVLAENQIAAKAHPIIVRQDSSGVALNDDDRQKNSWDKTNCPINKWLFDQLITKVDIPHIGGDDMNGTIAISYTKRGISVAFGLNVNICDNLCILGGQQLRTYKFEGSDGMDWETMKIHLKDWIHDINQRLGIEVNIAQRMMERPINNEVAVDQVIGKLYQKAIEWRYMNGDVAPFDISGMSTFVQNVKRKSKDTELNNVWDLYNWGTEVIKPEHERIEHLVEANKLYGDFLCQEFAIEREDLFVDAKLV